MTETRKLRVFLCHASQDKPIVRELYQRLSAEGWIDPWLDEENLLPGQDWDMEIENAVEAADVVIVCLSSSSTTKEGYIQRELRFVLETALTKPEETIFIIPLRLDDSQLPRRLRPWQSVDFYPSERIDKAYGLLLKGMTVRAKTLEIFIPEKELTSSSNRSITFDKNRVIQRTEGERDNVFLRSKPRDNRRLINQESAKRNSFLALTIILSFSIVVVLLGFFELQDLKSLQILWPVVLILNALIIFVVVLVFRTRDMKAIQLGEWLLSRFRFVDLQLAYILEEISDATDQSVAKAIRRALRYLLSELSTALGMNTSHHPQLYMLFLDDNKFKVVAYMGVENFRVEKMEEIFRYGTNAVSIAGHAVNESKVIIINDLSEGGDYDSRYWVPLSRDDIRKGSFIAFPIVSRLTINDRESIVAMVCISSQKRNAFDVVSTMQILNHFSPKFAMLQNCWKIAVKQIQE